MLRQRVSTIHWKGLIHELALVLGFEQIRGVEVFRIQSETESAASWYH